MPFATKCAAQIRSTATTVKCVRDPTRYQRSSRDAHRQAPAQLDYGSETASERLHCRYHLQHRRRDAPDSVERLLKRAEAGLYRAKSVGQNLVPDLRQNANLQVQIVMCLQPHLLQVHIDLSPPHGRGLSSAQPSQLKG